VVVVMMMMIMMMMMMMMMMTMTSLMNVSVLHAFWFYNCNFYVKNSKSIGHYAYGHI
jgi:hypothetical protein